MRTKHLTLGLGVVALLLTFSCQKTQTLPPVPVVNAGPAQTINLPSDTAYLTGSATDSASQINGYVWSQISGPNTAVFSDDGSPNTTVSGLIAGTYVFQLMATAADGQTGVSTVTITVSGNKSPTTLMLYTLFPGTAYSPYEMMYLGNSSEYNPGNSASPELIAETWTINGIEVWGRSFFKFNLSPIPSGVTVLSATLHLFSDTLPDNGNLVDANYGPTNDFWITRVSSTWDKTLGWNNFPSLDSAGQAYLPQTDSSFANENVDVTAMVNNMLINGNYGFEMHLNTEQIYNSRIFCSTLYPDSTRRPYIVVSY